MRTQASFGRICWLLLSSVLCQGAISATQTRAAEAPRPNIVLIFIDDLGYADIGPFGNPKIKTPHLDRLAAEGRKFTSFYATPVCSMSRAALMTGCYNTRVSVPGVLFPDSKIGLNPEEITVAEILKQRGYATACIGKWHLGYQQEFLPTRQGFDYYFGLPYSNDMRKGVRGFPPLPLVRGEEVIETEPDQSQLTRRYTEEAVKFIAEHKQEPFFVYLPHTMVHVPLFASEKFQGKSALGLIGDTIEEIDWSVGQVMETLREQGLDEKTLVIFTSDNGPDRRAAGPLRGSKASVYEGGVREPCIMRWPGRIPPGTTCERIAGNIDVLPTLAKLAGGGAPTDREIDGRDISRLMFDANPGPVREKHLHFNGGGKLAAIRVDNWKLIRKQPGRKGQSGANMQLFDLAADPGESKNVADVHPDIVARLSQEAEKAEEEIQANKRPPGTLDKNR
jgi:arylsulfatase A-like enzyme